MKKQLKHEIEQLDIEKLNIKNIDISVDGKTLPLKIGSKICIETDDPISRTVIAAKIDINGNATYCLEWFDGVNLKYEWMSLSEIYYMHMNTKKRQPISLDEHEE